MTTFASYIEELEKEILRDLKKDLEDELQGALSPYLEEKERLESQVATKEEEIQRQKTVVQAALKQKQESEKKEKVSLLAVKKLWDQSVEKFFNEFGPLWFEKALTRLPETGGEIRLSPDRSSGVLKSLIQKLRPKIPVKADATLSEGFVYESSEVMIDCTRNAFSEHYFPQLRLMVYQKLKEQNIV